MKSKIIKVIKDTDRIYIFNNPRAVFPFSVTQYFGANKSIRHGKISSFFTFSESPAETNFQDRL